MQGNTKKLLFFSSLSISLFLLVLSSKIILAPADIENKESWFVYSLQNEMDSDNDETADIITNIIPHNDTHIEILVDQTTKSQDYEWHIAICNITPIESIGLWRYDELEGWVYNETLKPLYKDLSSLDYSSNWCNETSGYGFDVLDSAVKGSLRLMLNFSEDHKTIQLYTGTRPEIKELSTSREYFELQEELNNFFSHMEELSYYSYINGEELHIQDINLSIDYDGKIANVIINVDQTNFKNYPSGSSYYAFVPLYRFNCFEYPKINGFDTIICPNQTWVDQAFQFAKQEMSDKMFNENISHSYTFYLKFDDTLGVIESMSQIISIAENDLYENVRAGKIDDYLLDKELREDLYYTISGVGNCIKFPLNRHTKLTINVTMPSTIKSYNFGSYSEIVEEYNIEDNKLNLKIISYPCCKIQNMSLQWVEICT